MLPETHLNPENPNKALSIFMADKKKASWSEILLDQPLIDRFAKIGTQKHISDPLIVTRFSTPQGAAIWYVTEYNQSKGLFYGYYTDRFEEEWCHFSVEHMKTVGLPPFSLKVVRDTFWEEKPFSQIQNSK